MAPALNEGDDLVVRHGTDGIRTGDVVVFHVPGRFFVHRVLRVNRRDGDVRYLVKADQRREFHGSISGDDILGKVVEVRAACGRVRLDSIPWRIVNRLLALRSYVCGRRFLADSPFWRMVDVVYALRSRLVPTSQSITLLPLKVIRRVHRIRRDKLFRSLNG